MISYFPRFPNARDLGHPEMVQLHAVRDLTQNTPDRNFLSSVRGRSHYVALDRRTVHGQRNAVALALALDGDLVDHSAEDAGRGEARPVPGNHRSNLQPVERGADAQYQMGRA